VAGLHLVLVVIVAELPADLLLLVHRLKLLK